MARSKSEEAAFRKAIDTFGEASQLVMLFEEMSELQKEICKAIRYNKRQLRDHVAEELADVEIMLEQTKMIFDVDDDTEMWRLDKVVRLRERLGLADRNIVEGELEDGE